MARGAGKRGKGKVTNAEGASKEIAPDNGSRQGLTISNGHTEKKLWLAYGETATAEEGVLVEPKTTFNVPAQYTGPVFGIGSPLITYAEF